jgi:hypothetical protein
MSNQPLTSRVIKTESAEWKKFKYIQQDDFKQWTPEAKQRLKSSILTNEFTQPFYVWQEPQTNDIYCLDGRHRTLSLEELIDEGHQVPDLLDATFIRCDDKKDAAKLVLIYSSIYARISQDGMFDFMKMYDLDYGEMKLSIDLPQFDSIAFEGMFDNKEKFDPVIPSTLTERFIIPPFSIFDSRQGYWQERKKAWHSLGFDSQETREDIELVAKSGQSPAIYALRNTMRDQLGRDPDWDEIIAYAKEKGMHLYEGASIFDPVLTEICYKWFCPEGGSILDPFAGGSVRGIVAMLLGFHYTGIDLRYDQVKANNTQAIRLCPDNREFFPSWYTGDSSRMDILVPSGAMFDFVFSCPPYHDLEHYSDDPADLSNMDYEKFLDVYRLIIFKALMKLKADRFACFVISDIRDRQGFYRDFVSQTIDAFTKQSLCDGIPVHLYNEIILINVAGSLPVRVGRQFESGRKVGKMHQNVLVFYKGDPKKIRKNFPEINVVEDLQELNNQPNIAPSVQY